MHSRAIYLYIYVQEKNYSDYKRDFENSEIILHLKLSSIITKNVISLLNFFLFYFDVKIQNSKIPF